MPDLAQDLRVCVCVGEWSPPSLVLLLEPEVRGRVAGGVRRRRRGRALLVRGGACEWSEGRGRVATSWARPGPVLASSGTCKILELPLK